MVERTAGAPSTVTRVWHRYAEPINSAASEYGVPIVEDATYRDLFFTEPTPPSLRELDDACEALGAEYRGRPVGSADPADLEAGAAG